jgi:aerobic C4-dicarboxylate transport protein
MLKAAATSVARNSHHQGHWYRHLYLQVLAAILIGVILGHFYPSTGEAMKPLGDAFIKMIKALIAPIIFFTVVHGIAGMKDIRKVGRVGLKALVYFEAVTTLALVVGLLVVNMWRPGAGMNVDLSTVDTKSLAPFTEMAKDQSTIGFLIDIIPATAVGAFADGEILQVLFFAILFAFGLQSLGERGEVVLRLIDVVSHIFFRMIGLIMKFAPIGAFGAMAFTIGKYGIGTLVSLGNFMLAFYTTCLLFIFVVLGSIAAFCGFSICKFIRYIKEELLIVLGTSSSESVLPRMITKMQNLGCDGSVVGLVIPTGYSFNLDGTCIYLTMAAIFLAQATSTDLTLSQELGIIAVLLLTSKGAAGVTGSGFVVLAGTLASVGTIPVASIALILGIDRFMSEARALTNLIGNGLATAVVAKWEGALDEARLHRQLSREVDLEVYEPKTAATKDAVMEVEGSKA